MRLSHANKTSFSVRSDRPAKKHRIGGQYGRSVAIARWELVLPPNPTRSHPHSYASWATAPMQPTVLFCLTDKKLRNMITIGDELMQKVCGAMGQDDELGLLPGEFKPSQLIDDNNKEHVTNS